MAFTNSPLVDYTRISPNRTTNRSHAIDTITIHCVVGQCTVEALGEVFAPVSRQASSNYGIGYDGKIGMYCEEKDRSWCSSSGTNDHRAITIEVASDAYSPYKVTSKAYAALIDLCTDICKRNNIKQLKWQANKSLIGQVDKQNMTVHRWFADKSCPGDYLYNLHSQIAKEVNNRLGVNIEVPLTPVVGENTPSFKPGDIVKITGTKYYGGKSVPAWVRNKNWVVDSAAGDRIVVNKSEDGKNSIMSPFNASDLALAKQNVAPVPGTQSTGGAVDEKKIWDFLYGKLSNYFGVAGLMGNLYAESGLRSNNLQQYYETKLGYTDATYTDAVDNGTYTDFARDSAGYGLAQWTYRTRKQALLDFAIKHNKSIGDLDMQLEFLWTELNKSFPAVVTVIQNATSIKEASDIVLTRFECPADQSSAAKEKRVSYGEEYYNKYAPKNTTTSNQDNNITTSTKFSVGDIVNFAGGKQYVSAYATTGVAVGACRAKITLVFAKGTHKYHCRAINDSGVYTKGVFGWVDESDLSYAEQEWVPQVGDAVMFTGNTHYISANSAVGVPCKGGDATITSIYQPNKSKHPYQLRRSSGSKSTVYGWVDKDTFTKL